MRHFTPETLNKQGNIHKGKVYKPYPALSKNRSHRGRAKYGDEAPHIFSHLEIGFALVGALHGQGKARIMRHFTSEVVSYHGIEGLSRTNFVLAGATVSRTVDISSWNRWAI